MATVFSQYFWSQCTYRSADGDSIWNKKQTPFDFTFSQNDTDNKFKVFKTLYQHQSMEKLSRGRFKLFPPLIFRASRMGRVGPAGDLDL